MTRLWSGGAELQSLTPTVEISQVTATPTIETTTKRSGNAAWRITNTGAAEGLLQIHTAAQGKFFFQFYLYIVAMPTGTTVFAGARQTGTEKIVLRLTAAGLLQLYNAEDSAQVGADSSALSTATWYRVAMMYDSTTLASTSVEARAYTDVAGAAAFWNPSGTIDITATPNRFGCFINAANATFDYIVDDWSINDTIGSFQNDWPPEEHIIVLRPNGNGDNSTWNGSDGNSTDNYLLIDEVPPDSADYVEENTTNATHASASDDYAMEDTSAALASDATINWVGVGVYAAVSDATSADPDIRLRIKPSASGTVDESTASLDCNSVTFHAPIPLPGNDNYTPFDNDSNYQQPGTANAWTKATLDTMQCGVFLSVTDTHFARVGALWAMVSYTPASGAASYTETGADIYGYVAAGADSGTFVDAGAAVEGVLSAGADQQAGIDAGNGLAGMVAAGAATLAGVDTGSAVIGMVSAGTDVGAFVDSGAAVFGGQSSGAEQYTGAGGTSYVETGFAAFGMVSAVTDAGGSTETGAGVGGWVATGADIGAWVDGGSAVVGETASGAGQYGGVDTGAGVLGWVVAGADVQAMPESGYSLFGMVASGDYPGVLASMVPAFRAQVVSEHARTVAQVDGAVSEQARKVT